MWINRREKSGVGMATDRRPNVGPALSAMTTSTAASTSRTPTPVPAQQLSFGAAANVFADDVPLCVLVSHGTSRLIGAGPVLEEPVPRGGQVR
jgi:hypothetical protein